MKTCCQSCILIGLVIAVHSGPIPWPDRAETSVKKSDAEDEKHEKHKSDQQKIAMMVKTDYKNVMDMGYCGFRYPSHFSTYDENVKWQKKELTYRIENYASSMPRDQVIHVIDKASQVWAKVTPLKLTRIDKGTADIMISFGKKVHGDPFPFDGPNGTLAHAYPPFPSIDDISGDIHFDDDEYFTLYSRNGFVLFVVAVHEFGHSLGLQHSNNRDSVMYPIYQHWDPNFFVLPKDDREGIQSLYGLDPTSLPHPNPKEPPHGFVPEPKEPPYGFVPEPEEPPHGFVPKPKEPSHGFIPDPEEPPHGFVPEPEKPSYPPNPNLPNPEPHPILLPDICQHKFVLDAVTTLRGELLFFKDRYLWRIDGNNNVEPYLTRSYWKGLPWTIDAAYENTLADKVFIFKGRKVWEISHDRRELDNSKTLSSFGLPSSVEKLDAALYDETSHKTMFFVNKHIYSYDERRQKMDKEIRLVTDVFPGLPVIITAAVQFEGNIYLISGPFMYEIQNKRIVSVLKSTHFFNCI